MNLCDFSAFSHPYYNLNIRKFYHIIEKQIYFLHEIYDYNFSHYKFRFEIELYII